MPSQPLTVEQLEAIVHREVSPLRGEISELRRSLDGESGLRVTVARLDERVDALRRVVEDGTPPEPPERRDPPPSDPGALAVRLPAPVVRWLLGALTIGGLGAGAGWQGRALVAHEEPPATVAAPASDPSPRGAP